MMYLLEERLISAYLGISLEEIFTDSRADRLVYARRLIWSFLYSKEINGVTLGNRYNRASQVVSIGMSRLRDQRKIYKAVEIDIKTIRELLNEIKLNELEYEQEERKARKIVQKIASSAYIRKSYLCSMSGAG